MNITNSFSTKTKNTGFENLQLLKIQFHFFHQLNPSIDQEAI